VRFDSVAKEIFQILRSFDYEVLMFDEEHNEVYEPELARRFFAAPKNMLVSIVDAGEGSSVRLYLSKSTKAASVLGLINSLRTVASKYSLIFNVREYERTLSPKDFSTHSSINENKGNNMKFANGMYGTSRSSYLVMENAKIIVRHSRRIDESIAGARTRNIGSIFVENNAGERIRVPSTHLGPAKALASHINFGGSWADQVGEQIIRMARDFDALRQASIRLGNMPVKESARELRDAIHDYRKALMENFVRFCHKRTYKDACSFAVDLRPLRESAKALESEIEKMGLRLPKRLIESAAVALEQSRHGRKLPSERNLELISVLGRPVNKPVWEAFKRGQIELIGRPNLNNMPRFTNPVARLAYKLRQVVAVVKDDSLTNLLSFVADELVERTITSVSPRQLQIVALQALKAAGVPIQEGRELRKAKAMREFYEWAATFHPDVVLEYDRFSGRLPDTSRYDHAVAEIVGDFDYEDFMASDAASEFFYSDLDKLTDEEKTISQKEIQDAIETYIEDQAARYYGMIGINVSHEAKSLMRYVTDRMRKDGYIIEIDEHCGVCPEDRRRSLHDDVTHEDVLLPKDKGEDFKREVAAKTVRDPHTGKKTVPDQDYVARLQSLAGVK